MDQAIPNRKSQPAESDYEIVYDADEFNLYKTYKKYEQLGEQVEERLNKIRNKKNNKKSK